jgi:PPM family protein phosphatase
MKYYEYTNKGPRSINEDSYFAKLQNNELFACIADGVGGMKHGDVASKFVTEKFSNYLNDFKRDQIKFIKQTNKELIDLANKEFEGQMIYTTFTAAVISSNFIKIAHTGDSRICILRDNGIKQLTDEHNEAGRLLKEGKLNQLGKNN